MNIRVIGPTTHTTMEVAWLEVETNDGNFVIQPDHAPMILALLPEKPVTICLSNGKIETFPNLAGILEIQRTSALLLLYE